MSGGKKPTVTRASLMTAAATDYKAQLDSLVSAAKEWRNATESRLRFLDSRGEAAKSMLKADADFCEAIERAEQ